jgi:hypothetical protein
MLMDGHLGLGRQIAAHLVDLGADLGEARVAS